MYRTPLAPLKYLKPSALRASGKKRPMLGTSGRNENHRACQNFLKWTLKNSSDHLLWHQETQILCEALAPSNAPRLCKQISGGVFIVRIQCFRRAVDGVRSLASNAEQARKRRTSNYPRNSVLAFPRPPTN